MNPSSATAPTASTSAAASAPLADLERVTRRFGATTAVDDVSLTIPAGGIIGLLGPNGAGKSTLLGMLQGRRRPTSGRVRLFGHDPRDARARTRFGSTPQETALPETLRVGEVIDFVGAHFAHRVPTAELADEFGLGDLLRRQTGGLSGGQKRRVAVALAFVGAPELVLLDEPSTGLDVDARRALWDAVRRQNARGTTVVVTSHYLEEIEALADRVVVVAQGRVLADDALRGILDRVGHRIVTLDAPPADLARIAALSGVARASGDGTFVVPDADAFVRALVAGDLPFRDLTVRGASLEEAFLALTDVQHDTAGVAA